MAALKLSSKTTAELKFIVEEQVIQRLLKFPPDRREATARRWFAGCNPEERNARVAAILRQARARELH